MTRVLISIPHIFHPREGSLYSSESKDKRDVKEIGLYRCTIENLARHSKRYWIHASLGKGKPVVTRQMVSSLGVDMTIEIHTIKGMGLTETLPTCSDLNIIEHDGEEPMSIAHKASVSALSQYREYDLVCYMEDDLLIEDTEFFDKIAHLARHAEYEYTFIPHRCEQIPSAGDVVLSGDPDGGRDDLFWATGEKIMLMTPFGCRSFYRATNPHSGCYFLSARQAEKVYRYWESRGWIADFQLCGPLEQAASGLLLPILKIMKPTPDNYRYLMVRHQDSLWKRHPFEGNNGS